MLRTLTLFFASLLFSLQALAAVNVNTASESELTSLPGIGPAKAAAIVQVRTQNGPFASLADLDAVPGIASLQLGAIHIVVLELWEP